jgi:poly(3-hydroxybutyrate) depolymerase
MLFSLPPKRDLTYTPATVKSRIVSRIVELIFVAAFCFMRSVEAADISEGTHQQSVDLGGLNFEILTFRPKHCTPVAMLLVFHGLHRGVLNNLDDLHKISNELCLVEAVPLFDEQLFPGWRYQKGGVVYHGKILPADQWTGNFVLRLIDWVRVCQENPRLPYILIGHSAGAQFLSRFAAYIPSQALSIIIANPSSYVLPSADVDAPFGFRGVYPSQQAEAALRDYLAMPITIVLGKEDVGNKDLDEEVAAVSQGKNRYLRGMNTFRAAQTEASRGNWPFQWKLIELPRIGHSTDEVYGSKAVKQVLRDAVAACLSTQAQKADSQ